MWKGASLLVRGLARHSNERMASGVYHVLTNQVAPHGNFQYSQAELQYGELTLLVIPLVDAVTPTGSEDDRARATTYV